MKNTLVLTDKKQNGSVKLFCRKNKLNSASLYLEIYYKTTQKRKLEFLSLYLTGNEIEDAVNLDAAKKACINYIISDDAVKKDKPATFDVYVLNRVMAAPKEQSRLTGLKALKKLRLFLGKETISYKEVDNDVLQRFKIWLLNGCLNENALKQKENTTIKRGTADIYYVTISSAAKDARERGYIPLTNFYPKDIKSIGRDETEPVFLTPEQVVRLQNTPMPVGKEEVCKAAILQYECGQRWSDVICMTWEGLQRVSDNFERVFNQIKTGNLAFSAFNQNLLYWIANVRERKGLIFKHGRGGIPKDHAQVNKVLNEWCRATGIAEKIGTHTFRRSFAKHLWLNGADIYSIMQLLGHKTVKQTQKYIGTDKGKLKATLNLLKPITSQFSYNQNKEVATLYKAV